MKHAYLCKEYEYDTWLYKTTMWTKWTKIYLATTNAPHTITISTSISGQACKFVATNIDESSPNMYTCVDYIVLASVFFHKWYEGVKWLQLQKMKQLSDMSLMIICKNAILMVKHMDSKYLYRYRLI